MGVRVIGIDCATDDTKVGLALADFDSGNMLLRKVTLGSRTDSASSILTTWLHGVETPALLAVDAPLGWPATLAQALANHSAGEDLVVGPNELFRRATDRFIQARLSRTPLDVGADRIARTAHAALSLLATLRVALDTPLPVAWEPEFAGVAAIEVYPAATLVARRCRSKSYKKPTDRSERREILSVISREMDIGEHGPTLESNADALDAVVCVLAAKDFMEGNAMAPENATLARREGWIWAASPRMLGV